MHSKIRIATTTVQFTWIVVLFGLLTEAFAFDGELPCHYFDSIDISEGFVHSNKSITFDGIEYHKNQYAIISYELENGKRVPTKQHTRGCICQIKNCIQLCCPFGTFANLSSDSDNTCNSQYPESANHEQIINQNIQIYKSEQRDEYAYVVNMPCKDIFYTENKYEIDTNGYSHIDGDAALYTRENSCILDNLSGEEKNENEKPMLSLLVCIDVEAHEQKREQIKHKFEIKAYVMLFSVPFIIATIAVYCFLPQLLNVIGKCLICYLSNLGCLYIILAVVQIKGINDYIEELPCILLGYTTYFLQRSAFAWASVIGFDLCLNFRNAANVKRMSEKKKFWFYALYTYVLSTLLTFICYVVDSLNVAEKYKPQIGKERCAIQSGQIPKILFDYLPTILIFILNIVFYISSAMIIHTVQHDLRKTIPKEEKFQRQNSLINKKDRLMLYLRLFVVMGISWIADILSAFGIGDTLPLVADVFNGLQGVMIFVLFVLKRKIWKLLKKRWQTLFGAHIIGTISNEVTHSITVLNSNNIKLTEIHAEK